MDGGSFLNVFKRLALTSRFGHASFSVLSNREALSEAQVSKNEEHYYYNANDVEDIIHSILLSLPPTLERHFYTTAYSASEMPSCSLGVDVFQRMSAMRDRARIFLTYSRNMLGLVWRQHQLGWAVISSGRLNLIARRGRDVIARGE